MPKDPNAEYEYDDRLNPPPKIPDEPVERQYECSGCGNRFPVSEMIDVYDNELDQFFIFCKQCWEKRR